MTGPSFPPNVLANFVRVLMTPADEMPVLDQRWYRDEHGAPRSTLDTLADLIDSRAPAPLMVAQALPGAIGEQTWRPVALTLLQRLGLRDARLLARAVQGELEELAEKIARHDAAPKRGAA